MIVARQLRYLLRRSIRLMVIVVVLISVAYTGLTPTPTSSQTGTDLLPEVNAMTIWSGAGERLLHPRVGPDGNVYFTDDGRGSIGRLNPETDQITAWRLPHDSRLNGLSIDPLGNVYYVDQDGRIGRLAPDTNTITEWTIPFTNEDRPVHIAAVGLNLFFTLRNDLIGMLDPGNNTFMGWKPPIGRRPSDIYPGPQGFLYFSGGDSSTIGRLNPATNEMTEWKIGVDLGLTGVFIDQGGLVFFAQGREGTKSIIGMLDPTTNKLAEWRLPTAGGEALHVKTTASGLAFYTLRKAGKVGVVDTSQAGVERTLEPAVLKQRVEPIVMQQVPVTNVVSPTVFQADRVELAIQSKTTRDNIVEWTIPSPHDKPHDFSIGGGFFVLQTGSIAQLKPNPLAFGYDLEVSPERLEVVSGDTSSYTVTVTLVQGKPQPVALQVLDLPAGLAASFQPDSVEASVDGVTSRLTVTADPDTQGSFALVVAAEGAEIVKSRVVSLAVTAPPAFDFDLRVSPRTQELVPEGSAQYTVALTLLQGKPQEVSLDALNPPLGLEASFEPASVVPTLDGAVSTLTVTAGPDMQPGLSIVVRGEGGEIARHGVVNLALPPQGDQIPGYLFLIIALLVAIAVIEAILIVILAGRSRRRRDSRRT